MSMISIRSWMWESRVTSNKELQEHTQSGTVKYHVYMIRAACDTLVQFDDSLEFQSNFKLQLTIVYVFNLVITWRGTDDISKIRQLHGDK